MAIKNFLLTLLKPLLELINKYGFFKTIGAIVMVFCICYTFVGVVNIPNTLRQTLVEETELNEKEHDQAVQRRRENGSKIEEICKTVLLKYNADRTCVLEMHNGTNNTAGLPFIYGEMTYEFVADGITHVDEDYQKINLSRFSFPRYMEEVSSFYGTIPDICKIDEKLGMRLQSNDVNFACAFLMYGSDNELGYFVIEWCYENEPKEIPNMMKDLQRNSQMLAATLDKK